MKQEKVNRNKAEIYYMIEKNPGINVSRIVDTLNINKSSFYHHLRKLMKEDMVKTRKAGGKRRIYPEYYDEKKIVEDVMKTNEERIYQLIKENPGITQAGISRTMGIAKQLVNYYIRKLISYKRIKMVKKGKKLECYVKE